MKLLIEVLLGIGGGLHSTDDYQSVMETSFSQDTSLVKFFEDMIGSYHLVRCAIAGA